MCALYWSETGDVVLVFVLFLLSSGCSWLVLVVLVLMDYVKSRNTLLCPFFYSGLILLISRCKISHPQFALTDKIKMSWQEALFEVQTFSKSYFEISFHRLSEK